MHARACGECDAWNDDLAGRSSASALADSRVLEVTTAPSALESFWLWEAGPLISEIAWRAVWKDALEHPDDPERVARAMAMKAGIILASPAARARPAMRPGAS